MVSEAAISSTIIREELGGPTTCIPQFKSSPRCYQKFKKLTLVIVVATRKLKFYLQTHAVIIMTHYSAQSRRATIKAQTLAMQSFFLTNVTTQLKRRQGQTNIRPDTLRSNFYLRRPKSILHNEQHVPAVEHHLLLRVTRP